MSVRVVARIRPLLSSENEIDTIVRTGGADEKARPNVVKVPNPKNLSEEYSFQFNSVYGEDATQQEIFDAEGKLHYRQGIELALTTCSSRPHHQAPLPRLRCYAFRLRVDGDWQNSYNGWSVTPTKGLALTALCSGEASLLLSVA